MIEPMRYLTLIVPEADRDSAVEKLRDLGVMQVDSSCVREDPEQSALEAEIAAADKALNLLQTTPGKGAPVPEGSDAPAILTAVEGSVAEEQRLQRALEADTAKAALLKDWGDFDPELRVRAEEFGLAVSCCTGNRKTFAGLAEKYVCITLGGRGNRCRFAVLSPKDAVPEDLPLAELPEGVRLRELEAQIEGLKKQLESLMAERRQLKGGMSALAYFRETKAAALEFLRVRRSVYGSGVLAAVSGFVPEVRMEEIRTAVSRFGWGFSDRAADPAREAVPTLLREPRWVHILDPLMDFLGIAPGYSERDVNLFFLFFFTIFFGMLIGDAGYGAVFLVLAGAGWLQSCRNGEKKTRPALALFTLLSSVAAAWGWMTGNCFGFAIRGIPWLSSDPLAAVHTQLVCFLLALMQLVLAHLLRMGDGGWKNILGQTGWILVLAGNFLLIYLLLLAGGNIPWWIRPALFVCYGVGIVLAAVSEIQVRDAGTIFSFPFSIISSFVDVLSYIRLFAVGMSSLYLARCFNDMGHSLQAASGWYIPLAALVVLLGHLLNIALGAMGVLVHGVRLNTLEFSSHLGLRWEGVVFAPFRKHVGNRQ